MPDCWAKVGLNIIAFKRIVSELAEVAFEFRQMFVEYPSFHMPDRFGNMCPRAVHLNEETDSC